MTDAALLLAMTLLCQQRLCLYLFTNDWEPGNTDSPILYHDLPGVAVELPSWEVAAGTNVTLASHPAVVIPLPHPCPPIYGWRVACGDLHLGGKRLDPETLNKMMAAPIVAGSSLSVEPWLRWERKDV